MMMPMDDLDRKIVTRLQDGIGTASRPFAPIADELGISEESLIARLQRLREIGVLSRFGPMFDAERMGGAFCLCAMAVPQGRFEAVTEQVNAHPEVAHNYEREHRFNMWFVLATETAERIEEVAEEIEEETGLAVLLFPKEAEFFVGFRLGA